MTSEIVGLCPDSPPPPLRSRAELERHDASFRRHLAGLHRQAAAAIEPSTDWRDGDVHAYERLLSIIARDTVTFHRLRARMQMARDAEALPLPEPPVVELAQPPTRAAQGASCGR